MKVDYDLPSHQQHLRQTELANQFAQVVETASIVGVEGTVHVSKSDNPECFLVFVVAADGHEAVRAGYSYFTRSLPCLSMDMFNHCGEFRDVLDPLAPKTVVRTSSNVAQASISDRSDTITALGGRKRAQPLRLPDFCAGRVGIRPILHKGREARRRRPPRALLAAGGGPPTPLRATTCRRDGLTFIRRGARQGRRRENLILAIRFDRPDRVHRIAKGQTLPCYQAAQSQLHN